MSTTLISLNRKAAEFISTPKKMLINGRWVESVTNETIETRNPATGEIITTVPNGGVEDINLAVAAARKAFDDGPWRMMKPNERAKLLLKLADLVEENGEELAHLETLDNGAPVNVTKYYPTAAADDFRYYAGWATKVTGQTIPVSIPGDIFNYTRKEAIGVCGQIIPWNGPFLMAVWKLSAPLATGNTVVLKPASLTPLVALRLGELVQEAGFPDGVVNIVTGSGSIAGTALTEHPDVDKIAFTGSTEVGRQIMRSSSINVKKVSLELGGKSAHIVFADANYDQAIANAATGIFTNSGQACVAGSRLFVEKKIYDNFMSDLADYTKNFKLGDGFDQATNLGPLISAQQKDSVLNYVDIGQQEGAEVLIGGNTSERDLEGGYYVKPTVIANVNNNMRIAQEEIFGPVISGIPFEDIDEVIKLANQTEYGLGGGVNTTDVSKAHRVAHGLRTGNVWVNTYNLLDPASPFGGYKQSGLGREHGSESIDMYTETKSVWINLD
ncbi:aldehyde dehydrogenase family protein [Oceanobacillus saliphilus]|uniref:aldehyde dehydrogenase family protein n=1 Tax=Oceanobacillus saliphilus TaxID=2925834 RepID=UPI00201E4563|nr:aldehyde dehydrogenase family protein [Oceanobacillus saliphilus]